MEDERIDFFKEEMPIESTLFGICDDEDASVKTPAYVDKDERRKDRWIARVTNTSGKPICFIAVDNKIEMRRDNGEMENRCDAMLHNDDYIVFVELKNQRQDWIRHAVEDQLLTTINIFKKNHDISTFRHKLAYACNQRHPRFAVSHKGDMQCFFAKYGVRLIISCDICIK